MTTNGSSPPVQTGLLEPIDFDNELPMAGTTSAPVADKDIDAQYNKDLFIAKPPPVIIAKKIRFDMSKPEHVTAYEQWGKWVGTRANANEHTIRCINLHMPLVERMDVDWFTANYPSMASAVQIKSDGVLQAEVDDLKAQVKLLSELVMANTNDIHKHGQALAWMAPIVKQVDDLMKRANMKVAGIVSGAKKKLKG